MKKKKINFYKKTNTVFLMGFIAISLAIVSINASFGGIVDTINYSSNYLAYADKGFIYQI